MKVLALALLIFSTMTVASFNANASTRTFSCTADAPLWSVIDQVTFAYDTSSKSMKLNYSIDGGATELTGFVDASYKARAGQGVRFAKANGDFDYRELTSESYVCEIIASAALVTEDSKAGTLTLRCRGESFEVGKYACKAN